MPTVDTINVEIRANIPALNASMAQAEKRVDTAAGRMSASVAKVSQSTKMSGAGGLFGSGIGGGGIRALSGLVLMHSVASAIQNYKPGSMSGSGANNTAYDKATAAVLDFSDALMKAIPVMGQFYEIGNSWYERMFGIDDLSATQGNNLRYAKELVAARDSHSADEKIRKRAEYEKAELEAMDNLNKRRDEIKALQGLSQNDRNSLLNVADDEYDNIIAEAVAKRDNMEKKKKEKGDFDTFGTVFGKLKIRNGIVGDKPKASKAEEDTAVATKSADKKLSLILKAITTNGVWS